MLRRVISYKFTDVSEVLNACVITSLVNFWETTCRNIPEDIRLHTRRLQTLDSVSTFLVCRNVDEYHSLSELNVPTNINPLKPKLASVLFKHSVRNAKKARPITITKLNLLMVLKEIIVIYPESYME
jgi:hypothetical protein